MIMQARIKATGKEILVEPYGDEYAQIFPDGDFKVYTKQELAFPNEIDWEQVRIQAAIEFAAQILGNLGGAPTSVAKDAVDYADALVEELKRSDNVYAECRRMDAINTAAVCENMTKIQKELQKKGGKE